MLKQLWECPKCHEHFYQYVIDRGTPVCGIRNKDCPAKLAAQAASALSSTALCSRVSDDGGAA